VAKTSVGPEVDPPKYENDDYYLKHDSEGKLWMVFDRKVGNRDLWVSIAIERVGLKRVPLIFLIFSMFPFILAIGVTCLVSYFLTNQTISLPVSNLARLLRKNDNFDPIHYDKNWPVELAPVIESVNEVLYKAAAIKGRLDSSLQNEKSFTANASHELLTPLAAIKSEVQLLAASDNEQSRSESISEILERVDRATHTIDQLIILSRLDPEERKKQFTQVNVVNTIQNSILLFAGEIEKKSLQVRFPETSELTVEGSGPFLEVLFRNIMSNCVKYSIEGTEIIISFNNVGDGVEVKFLNSSEPLPQYVQDFAFERFVRGPREKEIGVGLGMSIVKRIVEIHSGKITFKQKDDRKTVETSIIF
jgi:signal transduction histidine kinase